jgi:hypothetical protein
MPGMPGTIDISNDVFQALIWPRVHKLPQYFVLSPCMKKSEYYLVSKKWLQLKKPNIAELFYHYHIVNYQWPLIDDDLKEGLYEMLEKGFSNSTINDQMLAYLNESHRNIYDLISICHSTICQTQYRTKEVDDVCKALINHGIYYWGAFQSLLEKRYHEVWLKCYQLALKKGTEHKRDLSLISDRYEYDLSQYKKGGNDNSKLFESFMNAKYQYCIYNNSGNEIKPLQVIGIKEIYQYQFKKDKNAVVNFLNDFSLIEKTFGSYTAFKDEEIVQQFYKENQDFISDFFYKKFKEMYDSGEISLELITQRTFEYGREQSFLIDFLIYTKSYVLQTIANEASLNDEQVCFLFTYGDPALWLKNNEHIKNFGIIDTIKNFPTSFTNRSEDSVYLKNNYPEKVIRLQKILNKFRSEQRKKRPEGLIQILLSLKKIAIYLKVSLFIFFGSIGVMYLVHKKIENIFLRCISFITLLWLTVMSGYDFYAQCHARFVY